MDQTDVLRHTVNALKQLNITYMIVGSYGSAIHGEPRFTQDIDIVFELTLDRVTRFCASFPEPEFYLSESTVVDSIKKRFPFNILHPASGNKIDFMFSPSNAWGIGQLSRRQSIEILPGIMLETASPEDVIVGKLWYFSEGGSEKHLRDIMSILRVSGDRVDRIAVASWAQLLGFTSIWDALMEKWHRSQV